MTARTLRWAASTSTFVCLLAIAGIHSAQAQVKDFNVPAQSATTGIPEFARQAGIQILVSEKLVRGKQTGVVTGSHSVGDALAILLKGTGLVATSKDGATYTVAALAASPRDPASTNQGARFSPESRVARVDQTTSGPEVASDQSKKEKQEGLTEIVVTGTHIHGLPASASPVTTIDQQYIERSGYVDVADVIRSIPQNFSGGNNPQIVTAAPTPGNGSYSGGSSPNLRGLGSGSTLTLIDGHRLGQDGPLGAVDISLIPLAAVDHIDVVTDSSSAAYGSDAVAGVVNFILKKNYSGATTSVTYGDSTEGGGQQRTLSQLVGGTWESGSALGVYEYNQQDPLKSDQRSFTSTVSSPYYLLPETTRSSFYGTVNQQLTDILAASLDGLYTSRGSTTLSTFGAAPTMGSVYSVKQYAGNAELVASLPSHWNLTGTFSASQEKNDNNNFTVDPYVDSANYKFIGKSDSVELVGDGPLFSYADKTVQAALGGGYRRESYDTDALIPAGAPDNLSRHVEYAFIEVNAPILNPNGATGAQRLDLNFSGRYERYSDVGDKFVPKVGLRYLPADGVALRASWSQSFRAPPLSALNGIQYALLERSANPQSPTGSSVVLLRYGANPDLRPETADSWTVGSDFTPTWNPHLRFTATLFETNYRNRIETLNPPDLLFNPVYSPILQRTPSAAAQQAVIGSPGVTFLNFSGAPYDPATVVALADERNLNLQSQRIDGADASADYKLDVGPAHIDFYGAATYLQLRQQITDASPEEQLAGTAFNPPRFRARGGATANVGPWVATTLVNFMGTSTNTYEPSSPPVSSWTTFDLQLAYAPQTAGPLHGFRAALSVQNVFDKAPPFLTYNSSGFVGFHYDDLNTSPLGRFASIQFAKSFGGAGATK